MRGFSLAAQPRDGTFIAQLEQVLALHLPTRSDGVTSNSSTTQLLREALQAETGAVNSHHGALPSPLASSNPEVKPNTCTSQNSGPQSTEDQTTINRAVPPTHKLGTDGIGGVTSDQVARVEVN
nr:MAG: hypothetical protein 1 [Totiviridae sp.]